MRIDVKYKSACMKTRLSMCIDVIYVKAYYNLISGVPDPLAEASPLISVELPPAEYDLLIDWNKFSR